jgi:hypothetical protein
MTSSQPETSCFFLAHRFVTKWLEDESHPGRDSHPDLSAPAIPGGGHGGSAGGIGQKDPRPKVGIAKKAARDAVLIFM